MIVGAAVIELHVHDSQSLKSKRGVVRSIAQRVRNRFPIAIAEVGGQNTWQRAVLGLSTVGIDPGRVRAVLDEAISFVEGLGLAELVGSDVELLAMPFESASGASLGGDGDEHHDEDESA